MFESVVLVVSESKCELQTLDLFPVRRLAYDFDHKGPGWDDKLRVAFNALNKLGLVHQADWASGWRVWLELEHTAHCFSTLEAAAADLQEPPVVLGLAITPPRA
jgi:hypothetical protein